VFLGRGFIHNIICGWRRAGKIAVSYAFFAMLLYELCVYLSLTFWALLNAADKFNFAA
jgi:hypothetical protein